MEKAWESGLWRAARLAVALSSLPVWALAAQTQDAQAMLAQNLKDAQETFRAALKHHATLRGNKTDDCEVAEASDADLAQADPAGPKLAQLVQQSVEAQARCEAVKAAEAALKDARQNMRLVAQRLVAAASPASAVATAATPGSTKADLFKRAGEVQGKVDGIRVAAATAFDVGDSATAAALKVQLPPDAAPELPERFETWTAAAQTLPRRLTKELSGLQKEADAAVDLALQARALCLHQDGEACRASDAYRRAEKSLDAFDKTLANVQSSKKALDTARYGLETLASKDIGTLRSVDAIERRLAREINFRRLLTTDADVKSFFADDALGLSAAKSGTDATLRYTMNFSLGDGLRVNRLTLLGTAPATSATTSNPLRSTDGLAGKTVLGMAFQRTTPGFLLDTLDAIYDVSVGAKVARAPFSYLLADSNGVYGEIRKELADTEAFISVAGMFLAADDPRHLLTLSYREQRVHGYKNPSDGVKLRCLDDPQRAAGKPLDCVNAGLGAPTLLPNRVLSVELRYDFANFAVAPKLTRSFSAESTSLDLPIYFIRNKGDKTSTGFTGGISLGWDSARPGLNWGLFVSTPLSFSRSKPE